MMRSKNEYDVWLDILSKDIVNVSTIRGNPDNQSSENLPTTPVVGTREYFGCSQAAFAELLGITVEELKSLEHGERDLYSFTASFRRLLFLIMRGKDDVTKKLARGLDKYETRIKLKIPEEMNSPPPIEESIPTIKPGTITAKSLLIPTERLFLDLLKTAYPKHEVFTQVAFSAFLDPKKDIELWRKYNRCFADFLLVEKTTKGKFFTVAVIELDGSSHDNEKRKREDGLRDAVLNAAGYNTIRFKADPLPTVEDIIESINPFIEKIMVNRRAEMALRLLKQIEKERDS